MRRLLLSAALLWLASSGAGAVGFTVGTGAIVDLGTGMLDMGEGDLDVAGTLSAGSQGFDARHVGIQATGVLNGNSALMQVCGDWSNSGSFNPGTSTVAFVDGCGVTSSTITGANTFNDLSLTTVSGKQVNFEAAVTQTVAGTFTLGGASGNLLVVRSTVDGTAAILDLDAPAMGDYVDVKDNTAIDRQVTLDPNSVISGNAGGWNIELLVPALSVLGLAALGAILYLTGQRSLSRRTRAAV
jgi:hypothetical protein